MERESIRYVGFEVLNRLLIPLQQNYQLRPDLQCILQDVVAHLPQNVTSDRRDLVPTQQRQQISLAQIQKALGNNSDKIMTNQ